MQMNLTPSQVNCQMCTVFHMDFHNAGAFFSPCQAGNVAEWAALSVRTTAKEERHNAKLASS